MLYYGENLQVLREHIGNESIDLIYIDPPFNSKATYNLLFKSPDTKEQSQSQITAFDDTWHWGKEAQLEYAEIVNSTNTNLAELIQALRHFLKENDLMAYLVMMANRLIELHRVLKPTGSIYLHCDPTASHYLKLVLDAIFGFENFHNEIIWRRTNSHNHITKQYGPIHDTILFYSKSNIFTFHPGTRPYTKKYINDRFTHRDENGIYQTNYLTGPGIRNGESGKEWRGFNPTLAKRHWAIPQSLRQYLENMGEGLTSHQQLEALYSQGFIVFPKTKENGQPMYKQYIGNGVKYQDIWAYQPNTNGTLFESKECIDEDVKYLEDEEEKLGYPTQKPVGLLERIIKSSSNECDIVLDAFCGCGTAIHAAQKLNRNWIGIDITHLAISLIEKRLKDAFPDIKIEVEGTPKDLEAAKDLANRDKYQFQWWAVSLVNAVPFQNKKKGADSGIDGIIYFDDGEGHTGKYGKIIISVKGGEHINVGMIRDLKGTMEREKASIGLFITLAEPTAPMLTEAASAPLYASKVSPSKVFPTIQILTIKGLLEGTQRAEYPNLNLGTIGIKNTEREEKIVKQDELF